MQFELPFAALWNHLQRAPPTWELNCFQTPQNTGIDRLETSFHSRAQEAVYKSIIKLLKELDHQFQVLSSSCCCSKGCAQHLNCESEQSLIIFYPLSCSWLVGLQAADDNCTCHEGVQCLICPDNSNKLIENWNACLSIASSKRELLASRRIHCKSPITCFPFWGSTVTGFSAFVGVAIAPRWREQAQFWGPTSSTIQGTITFPSGKVSLRASTSSSTKLSSFPTVTLGMTTTWAILPCQQAGKQKYLEKLFSQRTRYNFTTIH